MPFDRICWPNEWFFLLVARSFFVWNLFEMQILCPTLFCFFGTRKPRFEWIEMCRLAIANVLTSTTNHANEWRQILSTKTFHLTNWLTRYCNSISSNEVEWWRRQPTDVACCTAEHQLKDVGSAKQHVGCSNERCCDSAMPRRWMNEATASANAGWDATPPPLASANRYTSIWKPHTHTWHGCIVSHVAGRRFFWKWTVGMRCAKLHALCVRHASTREGRQWPSTSPFCDQRKTIPIFNFAQSLFAFVLVWRGDCLREIVPSTISYAKLLIWEALID